MSGARIAGNPLLRISVGLFAMVSLAGQVHASVIGSPHDLYRQKYLVVKEEKVNRNPQCDQCHLDQEDKRPMIWQSIPPSMAHLGTVGILCASCHDGVSMVDKNVDAGLSVFHPFSHGMDLARAPSGTRFDMSGLPPLVNNRMSCLTCHNPHEQTYRPFLRVPFAGLCVRCHEDRKAVGFGVANETGDHPVDVEPNDRTGGASPIAVQPYFSLPFPQPYPGKDAILSTNTHWRLGGHLNFGAFGKVECTTCHAFHGSEDDGPLPALLAKDPVRDVSDEFCEGCHRGERGDGNETPPYPNPGGTKTGRTYHPADDDEANGAGWQVAIADTSELTEYVWGSEDPDSEMPRLLCTTCHRAHRGMEDSPCLVAVTDTIKSNSVIYTFCEVCHRDAPDGHHAYDRNSPSTISSASFININTSNLGQTFGSPQAGEVYCSNCHRAHNAGYGMKESDFIPLLIFKGNELCESCHAMGVSHFMGDPSLPSTYDKPNPALKYDLWPSGKYSFYEGDTEIPRILTCLSCHNLSPNEEGQVTYDHLLLAPANEEMDWTPGQTEEYLCTGCHGEAPATVGEGSTHPLMEADASIYPEIFTHQLLPGEYPVTYTESGRINCHSCHVSHGAVLQGGVYIMKIVRGFNADPKAIHPQIDYSELCASCHPYL